MASPGEEPPAAPGNSNEVAQGVGAVSKAAVSSGSPRAEAVSNAAVSSGSPRKSISFRSPRKSEASPGPNTASPSQTGSTQKANPKSPREAVAGSAPNAAGKNSPPVSPRKSTAFPGGAATSSPTTVSNAAASTGSPRKSVSIGSPRKSVSIASPRKTVSNESPIKIGSPRKSVASGSPRTTVTTPSGAAATSTAKAVSTSAISPGSPRKSMAYPGGKAEASVPKAVSTASVSSGLTRKSIAPKSPRSSMVPTKASPAASAPKAFDAAVTSTLPKGNTQGSLGRPVVPKVAFSSIKPCGFDDAVNGSSMNNAALVNSSDMGNAGLSKSDIQTALSERASWLTSLGKGAVIEDEEWEAESLGDEVPAQRNFDEGETLTGKPDGRRSTAKSSGAITSGVVDKCAIDTSELNFRSARARFISASQDPCGSVLSASGEVAIDCEAVGGAKLTEEEQARAVARHFEILRRLPRLRNMVESLEGWTELRKSAGVDTGFTVAHGEAVALARQTDELLKVVQKAVAAGGPRAIEELPQRSWLPTEETLDLRGVRQLVALQRTTVPRGPPADSGAATEGGGSSGSGSKGLSAVSNPKGGSGAPSRADVRQEPSKELSYEVTARARGEGGGWLRCELAERQARLEARVTRLRELLGQQVAEGSPLTGAATNLHSRLSMLEQVVDPIAYGQLQASMELLASDIEVALAEERRLEAVEEEDRAANISGDDSLDDMPVEKVEQIHKEVVGLDAVVRRLDDVCSKLGEQTPAMLELGRFAEDLAGAEARVAYTTELLSATLAAAQVMKASVESSSAQLKRNVAAIESKLEAREKMTAGGKPRK
eukprot:TRINITY_DN20006_c0_g1_i1.p1 TRINITY_DN20006_c0_g1~~TRINITY_DN20006_c0_g1_i1.p1  ORF type:complete len:839 (+),score=177.20 TRINITY_DN20006_c0_g1_i1:31-2517(+)